MGKNRTAQQTSTTGPDAGTQTWVDQYRRLAADRYNQQTGTPTGPLAEGGQALSTLASNLPAGMERGLGGIDAFYNPYQKDVIAGVQSDFDRQRAGANLQASDQATRSGSFGGSREAVLRSGLLGDVNRNEASTLANVRAGGFDTAANRLLSERDRLAGLGLAGTQGLLGYGQYLDTRGGNALDQYRQGLSFGGTRTNQSYKPPYNDVQDLIGLGLSAIPGIGGLFGKKKGGGGGYGAGTV